ncbi:hypothetical protein Clacol_002654 [Clathrus columnatus]|uniref:B-block binding subunit of TFIIIC domain-containing protein n=1 Tax=Clathrus columnatus TaxID=1419009 RepID=A0AAV5A5F8_9AGAM|nr:hypothetical protein Clacol_002654 [Clathrus columnatus]
MEELLRYIMHEIAFDGGWGCNIGRLKAFIHDYYETSTSFVQTLDDGFYAFVWQLLQQQPSVQIGLVQETSLEVYIAPQKSKKSVETEQLITAGDSIYGGGLKPIDNGKTLALTELIQTFGESLHIAVDPETCFCALTGSHIRQSKLTPMVYTALQLISRSRGEGLSVIDLGKKTGYDQKTCFYLVKQLLSMDLIVKLSRGGPGGGNFCIHKSFYIRSPFWRGVRDEAHELGERREKEDTLNAAQHPGQIFDEIDTRHLASPELIKSRIIKLLKHSENGLHYYHNLLVAIGFNAPTKTDRRFFITRIRELIKEKVIEKVLVPRKGKAGSKALCIRLVEDPRTTLLDGVVVQNDDECDDEQGEGYEKRESRMPHLYMTIQRQIVQLLEEAGAEGLTLNDMSTRLGMFDKRTLDLLLHRLEKSSPPHLADLRICIFIENLGRERRNRYFTLAGYEAFVQNENVDISGGPSPSSSIDRSQCGGFQLVATEMFYDSQKDLAKFEDEYRDRTNPPKGGTRKIGRPRKHQGQKASGDEKDANAFAAKVDHGRKRRRRINDIEVTELAPPSKRQKKARISTLNEGPVTAQSLNSTSAEPDNLNVTAWVQPDTSSDPAAMEVDSNPNQVFDKVTLPPSSFAVQHNSAEVELLNSGTTTTESTGPGGAESSLPRRLKSDKAKRHSVNLSQLRAENEIMRVVHDSGGIANIASKEFFEMHTKVLLSLESSGEPISMPIGTQLDRRTLRKILDRLVERGRLKTLTLTVTPRTIQPRLAKLVYTPNTPQENLDDFISSLQDPIPTVAVVHKELADPIDFSRPVRTIDTTSQDQLSGTGKPRPFGRQGKGTEQRDGIDFAGSDDEIRARFLADHRTTAQVFGFILGKVRRARELHQFTLQALQHPSDSLNVVSGDGRVIALSYYFQDIPISTYCSIISISEYNQELFDLMKTSSGRETRVGDLPPSLYKSLGIDKARARSRLFDLMEILVSLGLLTPLKPSDSNTPALVCTPNKSHPSSYDVASTASDKTTLNKLASYWRFEELAPIYHYSQSGWPPLFLGDCSVGTADESMTYWHELENACLEKGEITITPSNTMESITGSCKCVSSVAHILRRRQAWTSAYALSWEQREYLQRKWTDSSKGYTPLSDDDGGRRLLIRISDVVSAPFDTVYNFFLSRHQTFQREARRIRERTQQRDTGITGGDFQEKASSAKRIAVSKERLTSDWEHLVFQVHPGISSYGLAKLKDLRAQYVHSRETMTQEGWKRHIYEAMKNLELLGQAPRATRSKPVRRHQPNSTAAFSQGEPSVKELIELLRDAVPSTMQERTNVETEKPPRKQTRSQRFHWTAEYDDLARDASAILRTRCRSWNRMDWTALDQLFPSLPRNNVRQRIVTLRQVPGGESYFRRLEDKWYEIWMEYRGSELLPDPNPDHPSDFDLVAHVEFLRENVDKKLLKLGNLDINLLAEPNCILSDDVTEFLSNWDVTEYPSMGNNVDALWSSVAEEQREKILLGKAFVVEKSHLRNSVGRDDVSIAESALKVRKLQRRIMDRAETNEPDEDDYDPTLASLFLESVGERTIKLATENLMARGVIAETPKLNRKTPGRSMRITDLNRDASGGFYRPEFYKQALAFDDILEEDIGDKKEWNLLAQSGEMAGLINSVSRGECIYQPNQTQFAIDISESILHRKELDWNSKKVGMYP